MKKDQFPRASSTWIARSVYNIFYSRIGTIHSQPCNVLKYKILYFLDKKSMFSKLTKIQKLSIFKAKILFKTLSARDGSKVFSTAGGGADFRSILIFLFKQIVFPSSFQTT